MQLRAQSTGQRSLWRWVDRRCAFPCSLVDRIVPATSAATVASCLADLGVFDPTALATEAFGEWVLQNHFADDSDARALASWGVKVTDQVDTFEQAKLAMLNGSHTALALIGVVAGIPTVAQAMAVPPIREYIHALMMQEIAPQLARQDCAAYQEQLFDRFDNPHLQHATAQIAKDTTQKIGPRWLPTVRARLSQRKTVQLMSFAAAAFVRWCQGVNENGKRYALDDPLAERLSKVVKANPDTVARTRALMRMPEIWGDLGDDPVWIEAVVAQVQAISRLGIVKALHFQQGHSS